MNLKPQNVPGYHLPPSEILPPASAVLHDLSAPGMTPPEALNTEALEDEETDWEAISAAWLEEGPEGDEEISYPLSTPEGMGMNLNMGPDGAVPVAAAILWNANCKFTCKWSIRDKRLRYFKQSITISGIQAATAASAADIAQTKLLGWESQSFSRRVRDLCFTARQARERKLSAGLTKEIAFLEVIFPIICTARRQ